MKFSFGRYPKSTKAKQKISLKLDYWDTWNMDHALAILIHPMLKQLDETKHGSPYVDDEDVPEKLHSTKGKPKKEEWDLDSNHFKRWDWVMKEMIWAFGEHARDEDPAGYPEFWIKKPKKPNKKPKDWDTSGKFDHKKYDAYYKRKQNAFRLFGKYYCNLWD